MSEIITAEIVTTLDRAAAERLDSRIRLLTNSITDSMDKLHILVEQAKVGEIHQVLGYTSWTAYITSVFTISMRLDREHRRELVGYLSGEGMSQRAIAETVGISKNTVTADLAQVSQTGTPEAGVQFFADAEEQADATAMADLSEDEFEEVLAEARQEEDLGRENVASKCRHRHRVTPTTGLDGKTYQRAPGAKPRRRPLPDAFWDNQYKLDKIVGSLSRLVNDDRFGAHRQGLRLHDLIRSRDALNKVIAAIEGGAA